MNFSLLIRGSPELFAARDDPAQHEALFGPIHAYLRALREAGVFGGGAGLEPPATTTTLLVDGARWRTQDGPYAEAKEQLGGIIIFSADDHAEAVRWAQRCPLRSGRVLELRPNIAPLEG